MKNETREQANALYEQACKLRDKLNLIECALKISCEQEERICYGEAAKGYIPTTVSNEQQKVTIKVKSAYVKIALMSEKDDVLLAQIDIDSELAAL